MKGKSEQMMDCIEKMQSRTKWLFEMLGDHLTEMENINNQLQAEWKQNPEIVVKLNHNLSEVIKNAMAVYEKLQAMQESVKKVEAEKVDGMRICEDKKGVGSVVRVTGEIAMELDCAPMETNVVEENCSSVRERNLALKAKIAAANKKLKILELECSDIKMKHENSRNILESLQSDLVKIKEELDDQEKLQRILHNIILELKGNIRVSPE
ncbi:unnamed protein product [Urochloa humidicola]